MASAIRLPALFPRFIYPLSDLVLAPYGHAGIGPFDGQSGHHVFLSGLPLRDGQ